MITLALLPILLCLSLADEVNSLYYELFTSFEKQFNRVYADKREREYRLGVFQTNMDFINKSNKEGHQYVLGITPFSDITNDEFRSGYASNPAFEAVSKKNIAELQAGHNNVVSIKELPQSIDWREKGAVTNVKNQASCGSCWAFSAVGSVEGAYAQTSGELVSLSPQSLVDCDTSDNGCSGGLMDNAFDYIMDHGLPTEADYPYKAREGTCQSVPYKTSILGYYDVPIGKSDELVRAVSKNPVSVAIEADTSVFQSYKGGIITGSDCGHSLNHGVLVVGYSFEGTPYFIVKNSWGKEWGEEGYVRIGVEDGYGVCGINSMPSYAFVDL